MQSPAASPQPGVRIRPAARVVLLDDRDRLLLLKIHDPSVTRGPNPIPAEFWLLVGGGVDEGETYEEAAAREVFEETGLRDVTIGRCVWTQEKLVSNPAGEVEMVLGRYFVGRVSGDVTVDFSGHEPLEVDVIRGFRWLTRDEVVELEARETVLPPGLGALLRDVLNGGPAEPISLTDPNHVTSV
ncbi:MAG: NUDIX domain-containing protein [Hamadaea sp.]|nr:NUDIX domain-containing protein [Hamadaea sp.]